jgi:hypothetical protein
MRPALSIAVAVTTTSLLFYVFAYGKAVMALGEVAALCYFLSTFTVVLLGLAMLASRGMPQSVLAVGLWGVGIGLAAGVIAYFVAFLASAGGFTQAVNRSGDVGASIVVVALFFSLSLGSWLWGLTAFGLFGALNHFVTRFRR